MASGTSDILPSLSTTIPLGAGAFYLTEKIIAGQYSSITIITFSDTNISVIVEFSGDGVNFDATVTKNFAAGAGGTESTVILSKWMRLRIVNTSISPQTLLRVHTYANVENTSISASIIPVNGIAPYVNIANLPTSSGSLMVESPVTIFCNSCYSFESKKISDLNTYDGGYLDCNGSTWRVSKKINLVGGASVANLTNTADGRLELYVGSTAAPLEYCCLQSSRVTSPDCKGSIIFECSAQWNDNTFLEGRGRSLVGCISGMGRINRDGTDPFVGFGSYDEVHVGLVNELEICYGSGVVGDPDVISIHQPDWNVDKADGTLNLPLITASSAINSFRIIIELAGNGLVFFQIRNPSSGVWVTVHIISNQRVKPLFRSRGFAAFCHQDRSTQVEFLGGIQKRLTIGYMELQQSSGGLCGIPARNDSFYNETEAVSSGTRTIAVFRCADLDSDFQGQPNRTSAFLARITTSSKYLDSDAEANTFLKVLVWSVENDQISVLPSTWDRLSPSTPVETGFPIVYNQGIGPVKKLIGHFVGQDLNRVVASNSGSANGPNYSQGSSVNLEDYILSPGKVILIEMNVAQNDYQFAATFDFVTGV